MKNLPACLHCGQGDGKVLDTCETLEFGEVTFVTYERLTARKITT
jgi:hypothetical protein